MNLMELPCLQCTSLFCGAVCRFTSEPRNAAPDAGLASAGKRPAAPVAAPVTEQTIVDIIRHCGGA